MPLSVAIMAVVLALAAAVAVIGALSAVLDRRARLLRLAAMVGCYAGLELVALALLAGTWVGRPVVGRSRASHADVVIVTWILGLVLAAGRSVVGFRVEVEEPPIPAPFDRDDPVLVLAR